MKSINTERLRLWALTCDAGQLEALGVYAFAKALELQLELGGAGFERFKNDPRDVRCGDFNGFRSWVESVEYPSLEDVETVREQKLEHVRVLTQLCNTIGDRIGFPEAGEL